jgi:hypothetical protein
MARPVVRPPLRLTSKHYIDIILKPRGRYLKQLTNMIGHLI